MAAQMENSRRYDSLLAPPQAHSKFLGADRHCSLTHATPRWSQSQAEKWCI